MNPISQPTPCQRQDDYLPDSNRMNEWVPWHWFIAPLLLFLATSLYFLPYLGTGKTFLPYDLLQQFAPWHNLGTSSPQNWMMSDSLVQYLPWRNLYRQALLSGQIPWWNPYLFAGMPFVANGQSALFYPFSLLFLPFSLETGMLVFLALHQFITGFGMFLLLRRHSLSTPGALTGALAWMFTGFTTTWLVWISIPSTIAWLPWSLLAMDWVINTGKSKAIGVLALIVSFIILAGHLQFTFYVFLAMGFYLLWRLMIDRLPLATRFRRLVLTGVGIGLGVGISLVQLIPTLELSGFNSRGPLSIHELIGGAIPLRHLITLAVPQFFGGPNNYSGAGNFVEFNGYVGISVLLLGLTGLLHPKIDRRSAFWFFLLLGLIGLHLAYGGVLHRLLAWLPRYTEFRGLQRMYCLWSFGIAGFAGWGVDSLGLFRGKRRWLALVVVAFLAGGGIWLAWWPDFSLNWLLIHQNINPPGDWLAFISPYWRWAWLLVALTGTSVGLIVGLKPRISPTFLPVILLIPGLLITVDLLHFARSYLPILDKNLAYPMTPGIAYLQSHVGAGRTARFDTTALFGPLPANMGMIYGIEDIHGYDSFNLSQYGQLLGLIEPERQAYLQTYNMVGNFSTNAFFASALVDMLHVAHLITPAPLPDIPDVEQNQNDQVVNELLNKESVGQTFRATDSGLYRVDVMLATYARTNHGRIVMRLRESPSSLESIAEQIFDVSMLPDNSYASFTFTPLADSDGKSYYIQIESIDGSAGNAITAWYSAANPYAEGELWKNGIPIQGDLRFRTFTNQNSFRNKWQLAYSGPDLMIYANRNVLPLAWVVSNFEVYAQPNDQLSALGASGFDPKRQAILGESPPVQIDPDASGLVSLRARSLNQIDLDVTVQAEAEQAGLLVISQNFYPGWQVEIDGVPTRLLRANYTLQGVAVPAGSHLIRLRYQPRYVIIGFALSSVGGLVIFCLLASSLVKFHSR